MLRSARFLPQQNPPPERWAQSKESNRSRAELRSLYSCEVNAEAAYFAAAAQAAWYGSVTTLAQQDFARRAAAQGECVVVLSSRLIEQLPAAACLAAKRGSWGIENGLHYRLDVSALEDKSRVRNRNNVLALGLFRRLEIRYERGAGVRRAFLELAWPLLSGAFKGYGAMLDDVSLPVGVGPSSAWCGRAVRLVRDSGRCLLAV